MTHSDVFTYNPPEIQKMLDELKLEYAVKQAQTCQDDLFRGYWMDEVRRLRKKLGYTGNKPE